ncbi:Cobalamin biosynthesis bifunctional protein CbiET [bacterium HR36]|uniref:Precorrin-6Y C5,15-methyltransferase / precorrin-8W decarboxylase n=1 Tax=uncultured Planctomycetota bacterium TaxID=120965 RepID=H5SIK1_9BACT|nr:precorrin-6Y C5,15-methyltransferase / precorrin-8W decarboxylase [uncultured Planctomycetota bacterium]GBD37582.1 Cobalamin biosynthesis bifunctional protein CbiET [bacterium HR36]
MAEAIWDKVYVVGVGADGWSGLTEYARRLLQQAEVILASDNVLPLLPRLPGETIAVGNDLARLVQLVQENLGKRTVVLASGDPLFYGVAKYLCDRLGKERFEIVPHVSTMQLAFARIKESWEDAYLTNLATHPLEEVLERVRTAETVGLFTTEKDDPAAVARALLQRGLDYFTAAVCENLGMPNERVTQGELYEIAEMEFAPLNVLILKRKPHPPQSPRRVSQYRRFGNPEEVFAQSQLKTSLITKAEVRAIALALLDLQPTSTVWDIGAGSGSVSIEAAQLAEHGLVFAIEQDAADYHLILANCERFGVRNVRAIHGTAPAMFRDLPRPDAIFIGGTGKEVTRLLEAAWEALLPGGRLVVNVASLDALTRMYETLRRFGPPVEVRLIQIARGVEQFDSLRFDADSPTFLLFVAKPRTNPPLDAVI